MTTFNKAKITYDAATSPHVSFPMGGIGAGSVGIGADGRLKDWEIFNRPSKGSVNGFSHFAVRAEKSGEVVDTRVLHGPFRGDLSGSHLGSAYRGYGFGPRREELVGLPSFESSSLTGPYPVASLEFSDRRFPGAVKMSALSPFIPMDDRASSMPVAMFEVEFENTSNDALDYTLFSCISFDFPGADVRVDDSAGLTINGKSNHQSDDLDYVEISFGTDHDNTSYQRHAYRGNWFDTLEVYWADINRGGPLKDRFYQDESGKELAGQGADALEQSVLGCHFSLAPGEKKTIRVAISWYVPNMNKYWVSGYTLCCPPRDVATKWRNYYATQWDSASHVVTDVISDWSSLADRTREFQSILSDSTLPDVVIDAVSANISILKSPTVLRLEDGTFYGFEGCHADAGCCEGSCTHVWNYQQALPFLFPALERSMRVADFVENQIPETGQMPFRIVLPKGIGPARLRACADGQFGNVMKAFRDWKLHGDQAWLEEIWPYIKKSMTYAWDPANDDKWDPDKTGVLWGRQHHTLDMELFGPNSWLTGFYLGALTAAAEMAKAVGDEEAANEFSEIFERGKAWANENLFNGRWFYHQVDLGDRDTLTPYISEEPDTGIAAGNVYQQYWSDELQEIKYQIGEGCSIDQVLAEWHARIYGLEPIFDADKFETAVRAIFEHNYLERLGDIMNPCRIYGWGEESGTMICSFPSDIRRPAIPAPYSQETMHGFEYSFGIQLMMIGEIDKGLQVFSAVRDRYQGHNRNPWNEIECGSNYARSMANFAAITVLSGFTFDAVSGKMGFAPIHQDGGKFKSLWSNGLAWGGISIEGDNVEISVLGGHLSLTELTVHGRTFSATDLGAQADVHLTGERAEIKAGGTVSL